MGDKNTVVETKEVTKIIKTILDRPDINLYITDGTDEIKILLDDNAKNLLRAHYKSKELWGAKFNG